MHDKHGSSSSIVVRLLKLVEVIIVDCL